MQKILELKLLNIIILPCHNEATQQRCRYADIQYRKTFSTPYEVNKQIHT